MKRIVALMVAALVTGPAAAAEYGVGISAKSDNGLLYFPIDVSPQFRVEPYLRHVSSDSKQRIDTGGEVTTFNSESDQVEGGVGVFGLAVPKASVRLYYGARASYFDGDSHSTQTKQSFYGYRITPTIGFEYLFNSHFTLGGEVGYFFQNANVDTVLFSSHQESDNDTSGTDSFLILRYFF
jgi:hypothetical protein